MGCALILALVGLPRLALVWLWLARTGYITTAFEGTLLWPVLGFFFLPTTTLAFAYGTNSLGGPGEMPPLGWLLVVFGFFVDVGLHGDGARRARRRREPNH